MVMTRLSPSASMTDLTVLQPLIVDPSAFVRDIPKRKENYGWHSGFESGAKKQPHLPVQ